MTNKKLIWIASLFFCIIPLNAQENPAEVFFKETYLSEFEKASRSPIKENKISLANKILDECSVISNKSIQEYTLLKATELVNDFTTGYPVALKIHEKIIELSNTPKKAPLVATCNLIETYAKSLPSTRKEEKNELYAKQLKYELLHAQLLIKKYRYTDTLESLKKVQNLAKTLGYFKTNEMVNDAIKAYTPLQSRERNLENCLEKIELEVDLKNNLSNAVNILMYEFGNTKRALLLALRLDDNDERKKIAVLWRKYLARDTKASKSNIYFKEDDLDKSDNIIFSLLLADQSIQNQISPLFKQFKQENKKTIIDALKIGEGIIDNGEVVKFSEYDAMISLIEWHFKKATSAEAKHNILELATEILNQQLNDKTQQDDVTHAKAKIKIKEFSNLRNDVLPQIINLESIPSSIQLPDFTDLSEHGSVKRILGLINAKTYNQVDITDHRRLNNNLKIFLSPENTNEDRNPFDKATWQTLHASQTNTFNLSAEKDSVSVFHCYIHSDKPQRAKITLHAFGKPNIFLNTKNLPTKTSDGAESGEALLLQGENSIRIVVFHTNQSQVANERIILSIKATNNAKLPDIRSSTKTYRQ